MGFTSINTDLNVLNHGYIIDCLQKEVEKLKKQLAEAGIDNEECCQSYTYVFPIGTGNHKTIFHSTHGVDNIKHISLYDAFGNEVEVCITIVSNNIIINSNIDLSNSKIKIN